MKAIVIVEAISTALFYERDILDRGFLPLVVYPHIEGSLDEGSSYEKVRDACRKQLSDRTIEIPDDGNFEHLLTALAPYDIACVVAGSEMGVVLADRLAQALGLPGNPPASSLLHQNKDMMQEALREHGLRSIRGRVVHTLQEVRDWWKELSVSHVVLKPVAGAGTAGLHFCNSEEEASLLPLQISGFRQRWILTALRATFSFTARMKMKYGGIISSSVPLKPGVFPLCFR